MIASSSHRWDFETWLITVLSLCASLASFVVYFQHGDILLYGDAVAHINIARRVFDSRTPGLLQLGTVWLPLPHLLTIPFVLSDAAWQSGAGASIPSLICYVAAVIAVFRLVRGALSFPAEPDLDTRFVAWFAALVFAANPNILYLQTTAMTESLYLACFLWAVTYFTEFAQSVGSRDAEMQRLASRALLKCGVAVAAAEATRYDGWFLAAALGIAVLAVAVKSRDRLWGASDRLWSLLRNFALIVGSVPILWLAYNGIVYRNPLEFATGPYSAKAIERRTSQPGFPPHPGSQDLVAATQYFLKSSEANIAEGNWQRLWLLIAAVGSVLTLVLERRLSPLLLLWIPLPFYALSIAYGGVPVFVPTWWPFSYYNVRYGIQLLPAVAVFSALTLHFLASFLRPPATRIAVATAGILVLAFSYTSIWRAQPVCFREAWFNSRTRIALETALANNLRMLPQDATLLMYLGDHVGALQRAGIPLSRVINEGNHRTWKQPIDPEGLWERALADPAKLAEYAIGIGDDPVSISARQHGLKSLAIIETTGQPPATIYFTQSSPLDSTH